MRHRSPADRQSGIFTQLFAINFLVSLGFSLSDAFFPLYCESLGIRGALLGIAIAGYALSKVLLSPIMGTLVDRYGDRLLILASLGLYLFISCGYLLSNSLATIVCLRLLQGMGCAVFRPVIQTLVAKQAPLDQSGKVFGSFDISFYAALSCGPIIGGLLIDNFGFRGLFSVLTLCCVAALWLAASSVYNCRDQHAGGQKAASGSIALPQAGRLHGLLMFIFGRACGVMACATFLPIMLTSKLGLSGVQVGIVMASSTLMMALLLRPMGMAADRLPKNLLLLCGAVIVPLLYLLLPCVDDFFQALGVTLGIGAFSALSQPAVSAMLIEEGELYGTGSTFGTFNAVLNFGFILGPLIGSLLDALFGINAVFIVIGILGLLTAFGWFYCNDSKTRVLVMSYEIDELSTR